MNSVQNAFKKAFSVLEIVIVVALVAIVCAVAVPAVNQYLTTSVQVEMQNDGVRLGTAAQAYFAETFAPEVELKYNKKTGKITAPEEFQMLNGNKIAEGYEIPETFKIVRDENNAFQLKHPKGGIYTFNDHGELKKSEETPDKK